MEPEAIPRGTYLLATKAGEIGFNWDSTVDGDYMASFPDGHSNTITISNNDGTFFDWSASPNPIGAVIVKGGNAANIFKYEPQAFSDTHLYAPNTPSGNPAGVSHATFCWNPEEQEVCYEDETGWADGLRYTSKGNWATYTPYDGQQKTVTLYAGQTMDAGTVTFSGVNGNVIITIQLNEGWFFDYMDDDGEIEESVHIQGYDSASSGNPAPGQFDYEYPAMGQTHEATVPAANFYGVHVALLHEVPCPDDGLKSADSVATSYARVR